MKRLAVCLLVICLPLAAGNNYGKLPLSFEPNEGQTDARVKFLARVPGYSLFVTSGEAVFTARDGSVERMKLVGASANVRIEPLDKQTGISNYFIGNDPEKWRTDIPNYARVAMRGVYPGIDLIFYGNERQLEYDWVVAPGADPARIRVKWDGAGQVTKNATGDLVLSAALIQKRPVILQDGKILEGGYVLRGEEVGFEVAKYDLTKPLVIDPVLVYSSFLGGTGSDTGSGIATDGSGNAYMTGYTASTNFPTTASPLQVAGGGSNDAFVTKVNAAGTAKVYSTYLGGTGDDRGSSIAVDGTGNVYVTGFTGSTAFPTQAPLQASTGGGNDVFVTKINNLGNALVYSTYLGGSGNDLGFGIAVDSSGNAYLTGETISTNFPTQGPIQASTGGGNDVFVTKMNNLGSALVYSTYLGGSGTDYAVGIAVDSLGNAYVTGFTASTNFPTTIPLQATSGGSGDAFVAKINAAGSAKVYATYLGGSGVDTAFGIAVDGSGNAYVTGQTTSANFPTTSAFQGATGGGQDGFVTKINAAGTAKVYSTYLGGSNTDQGNAIAVDALGYAYVAGMTDSLNFPTTNPVQASNGGSNFTFDVFVTKINPAGSAKVYSTYLGGSGNEWGNGIAVDSVGDVFVTGYTQSSDFPTVAPFQGTYGGVQDAWVARIFDPNPVAVPNVVGVAQATATSTINGVGLVIGTVTWATSLTVPVGNVISESPVAGTMVTPGSAVNLTISEPVAVVSVSPISGSGASQIFTGTYAAAGGFQDLQWVQMLFAVATNGGGQAFCYVHYDVAGDTFWLYDDVRGFFAGPVAAGATSNVLQGSLCALNTSGSSVTKNGNTLTVHAAVVFKAALAVNVYLHAYTLEGVDTGWVQQGAWTTVASALGTMTVSPPSGSVTNGTEQIFTLTYPDTPGFAGTAFGWQQFLVAVASDGGGQPFCQVHYDRAGNGLWMYSSDVGFFLGPVTPGASSTALSSSACSVNTAGTTVQNTGGNLMLFVPVTIKSPMVGSQKVFERSLTVLNVDTSFVQTGTLTVN